MSDQAAASVAVLDWHGQPARTIQDVDWKLEDRDDSTNRLSVTTSLAEADGLKSEQELIFKQRRFSVVEIDRTRSGDKAVIEADEVQAELADLILPEFKPNSWTLEQAVEAVLEGTRWTIGTLIGTRYGRAEFEDISVLEALKFLARHQDARLSFDSLRRRVSIRPDAGTQHEVVFTYGRQLTDIEKSESAPTTTVIYPTGADGMTIESVNDGRNYVEDYGYYTAQGISLADARARYRKEDYWSDERYTVAENLLRDSENRLAVEAYPQIGYTLTAAATEAVDDDDFSLSDLHLGDVVHVWDEEIDAKLRAEVTAVTTSSDASENELHLSYLPPSLGAGVEGEYFGDSGRPSDGPQGRPLRPSQPQPRPSMPILEAINDLGVAVIRWNGQDHNGSYETIPELFGEVQAVAAPVVDGVVPSPSGDTAFYGGATGRRGGGVMHVAFGRPGEYAVWFQMVGRDGQTRSEFSEPLTVEVPEFVDTAAIEAELEAAQDRLTQAEANAQAALDETGQLRDEWQGVDFPALQQEVADAKAAVADAEQRLEQTRLGMENLRDIELPQLDDRLSGAIADANQWRDVGAISASSVLIGRGENLIPNATVNEGEYPVFWWSGPGYTGGFRRNSAYGPDGGASIWIEGRSTPTTQEFPVEGGVRYLFRVKSRADRSGKRFYIQIMTNGGSNPNIISNALTSSAEWVEHSAEFTMPVNATRAQIRVHANHTNGSTTEGVQWFGSWRMHAMGTGELLVDGTILARHLAVESVAAAIAEFLSLSAEDATIQNLAARIATLIELNAARITTGQLGAERVDIASLFADSGFIDSLYANVVTALDVTAARGFIGGALLEDDSITVAKLAVTDTMAARLFQAMEARIGDLAFNTASGMDLDAGRITTGSLTGRTVQTSNTWASTGGAVMRENGSHGNFVAVNDAGQTVARLGGARNELANLSVDGDITARSLALAGEARVGVGGTGEGALVPDNGRIRVQGRMPFASAGARDMYTYEISGWFSFTQTTSTVVEEWDIAYEEVAPLSIRSPMLGTHVQSWSSGASLTVMSAGATTASGFTARLVSMGNSGPTHEARIRYFSVWR